jgi:hypothetical protein
MTICIASLGASLLVGVVDSLFNRTGDTRLRARLPRGLGTGERAADAAARDATPADVGTAVAAARRGGSAGADDPQ